MAWAFVANRGSGTDKTSAGLLNVSPIANLNVGAVVVVVGVGDNTSTTNGATTDHIVSDSKGNSWTRIAEVTRSPTAVANDGTTVSEWVAQITTQILTTDTITFDSGWGAPATAMSIKEFSVGGGNGFSVAGSAIATGTSGTPSVTLSGLSSTTYEWIGALGVEGPNGDAYTQDADYTNNLSIGTVGGVAATNQAQRFGTRNFSGTSDTFNPTCTSRDWGIILGALLETTPPAAGSKQLAALGVG
jgi:hypothetical protein